MTLIKTLKSASVEQHKRALKNRKEFRERIAALVPTLKTLDKLGASVDLSVYSNDVNISITGDAAKLVLAVRALREAGYTFSHSPGGGGSWCSYFRKEGALTVWLSFSSSVCKLVQVGTKMVEQPIYETRCEGADIGVEEAVTL